MGSLCARWPAALLLLLLAGSCRPAGTEPLDGGRALEFGLDPDSVKTVEDDPCWRRENGGWHYSSGHCAAMTPPQKVTGVWVTAFEERSFYTGDSAIPSPRDWRRFTMEIELDEARAFRLARAAPSSGHGDAYLLSFIGRRTRDPHFVDCQGMPNHVFVVDRLLSARRLGALPPLSTKEFEAELLSRPVTVARKHPGRRGELEAEAVKRCT